MNIDWSFLDRGRVRARIAASQADGDAQLAQYQQSVLLALEDVENALVSYARSQDRDVQLQLAAKELQAEDAYAESHSDSALSAVLLYKSLAGGWPQTLPPAASGQRP
jgi:outer membrane protein TolC